MKNAEILFLNNVAMAQLGAGNLEDGIVDVKKIYSLYCHEYKEGEEKMLSIPDKVVLHFGNEDKNSEYTHGRINAMPGRVQCGDQDFAGIKWIGSGVHNAELGYPRANALVILNDTYTKLPVCIADATTVSATRTGAAGGVAVEYLARANASVLTLCGAGVQGRTQFQAALISRPSIKEAYIYDKFPASAEKYVAEMSERYPNVSFTVATDETLGECVKRSDIVITATTANSPFIKAEWITKGTLLCNISGEEVDRDCVRIADKTVVDFWASVKHRNSSTIARMSNDPEDKFFNCVPTAEIGEIINGKKPGRENDDEIIYFNPVGAGVLDMIIVNRCYQKAVKEGLGQKLSFWE